MTEAGSVGVRDQAVRREQRILLLIVSVLVLTVHSIAFPSPAAAVESGAVPAAPAFTASSALPCEESHSPGCPHESCSEAGADHCDAMLTNLNGITVDPDLTSDYSGTPDVRNGRLPRSAERAISLAQLQVWRH